MNWFYNLKISAKLLGSFLIIALIAAIVGGMGIYNLKKLDKADTELYVYFTVPLSNMGNISEAYQKSRVSFRDALMTQDPNRRAAALQEVQKSIRKMEEENAKLAGTMLTDDGKKLSATLSSTINEYEAYTKRLSDLLQAGQVAQVNLLMQGEGLKIAENMTQILDKLTDMKVSLASQKSDDNTSSANTAVVFMLGFVIAGVVVAVLMGIFIARIISRPIGQVVEAAGKIAEGDLNVSVHIASRDEIGVLAQAFNIMTDNINTTMQSINEAAEQVAAGSEQIAASGQALSQGSTEQASSIEEVTASMTEVAAQTKQNAVNANQANELAAAAKTQAVEGNAQMREMVKAMTEINESSANISKIIKVIDEIAFQTNILALNAAVEAARAGQHGKGFAVVAEEVRNLAARSANAAKETTAMIESSIKKVDAGTKMANDTAIALDGIVDGVAKAAALVGEIAAASNEQATAIAQINQAINQVSQVVQTNSATAEESASASEELSGQAEMMKENVRRFRLKNAGAVKPYAEARKRNRNPAREASFSQRDTGAKEQLAGSTGSKAQILLDDTEFGKY